MEPTFYDAIQSSTYAVKVSAYFFIIRYLGRVQITWAEFGGNFDPQAPLSSFFYVHVLYVHGPFVNVSYKK